ncbi:hypothetical protein [Parafrankia elaeagni]|uniref:hypothetical protein n=1 Tax=Parafrankia elaeagni TaxID=222534 RepID=UPI00035FF76D|nr:hypothetical protein [Parafrankia elaeagni]
MIVILCYVDERESTSTIVSPEVLRHADLPELASRLVRLLPGAERVRIVDDIGHSVADTGGVVSA